VAITGVEATTNPILDGLLPKWKIGTDFYSRGFYFGGKILAFKNGPRCTKHAKVSTTQLWSPKEGLLRPPHPPPKKGPAKK